MFCLTCIPGDSIPHAASHLSDIISHKTSCLAQTEEHTKGKSYLYKSAEEFSATTLKDNMIQDLEQTVDHHQPAAFSLELGTPSTAEVVLDYLPIQAYPQGGCQSSRPDSHIHSAHNSAS